MLAVAVSAHASTADPRIEVTLSPRLRTPPLPMTPAGVADRWRNIGSCRRPSLASRMTGRERCYESQPNCQRSPHLILYYRKHDRNRPMIPNPRAETERTAGLPDPLRTPFRGPKPPSDRRRFRRPTPPGARSDHRPPSAPLLRPLRDPRRSRDPRHYPPREHDLRS